jgi:Anti-sigma-K factor rskA, C-terminal
VTPSDDERIAYLAGEPSGPLPADERAELDQLRALLESPATWVEPAPGLEDRIVSAVTTAAGHDTAAVGETAKAADQAPQRTPSRWRSLFPRPSVAFASLGAAVAAIAVVVVLASGSSAPAPLHFAMVVNGTQLAPGVHGKASLTKTASGWRIELTATGLPHLQNGRFYQAWLKNSAGITVPVGTFNDARQVTLWSGVPVTKFRTLTVTEQHANGNPASSRRTVLIGTITPAV